MLKLNEVQVEVHLVGSPKEVAEACLRTAADLRKANPTTDEIEHRQEWKLDGIEWGKNKLFHTLGDLVNSAVLGKKIYVIKAIRELTGLNLAGAKEFVEENGMPQGYLGHISSEKLGEIIRAVSNKDKQELISIIISLTDWNLESTKDFVAEQTPEGFFYQDSYLDD